jgi:putative transposase
MPSPIGVADLSAGVCHAASNIFGSLYLSLRIILDFSRPGKPTDNAFIESFNARVRIECLNQHWFLDLDDARTKIELWRQDYNDVRPHSAIGERTPIIMFTAHRNTPMGSTVPGALI